MTVTGATTVTERQRNRLLRRVDWRFLLAQPVVDRLLCLADGDLREGCCLIAAHVDDVMGGDGTEPYQLLVAKNPDDHTLATALPMLVDGGELYAEWSESGDRNSIRTRLQSAGFADIRLYWPWPAPPDAEVWVPLDAPAAFEHYVTTDRHVYAGWRHRLGTRARRMAARWQLESERGVPVCVLARKPGGGSDQHPAEPEVVRAVRITDTLETPGERLTCALLTGGPRAISKVVGLAYAEGARDPALVVKWPRVPESEGGLMREAEALMACHARAAAAGVPRLLAMRGTGAQLAVAETAARGAPMFRHVSRSAYGELARHGASWLADFHAAHTGPAHDAASWRARLDGAMARFADTFGAVIEAALLDETARLLEPNVNIHSVIEHRDFGPWNILIDEKRALAVLDWESSRIHGLPLLDLIYFTAYMAFFVDGAMVSRRFAESYRAMLDARSLTGAVRHELMEQYRQRFGLSLEAEHALRALCWIEHADSEFQHFTADAGGRPTHDALRASVFVQLWKEEIVALRG